MSVQLRIAQAENVAGFFCVDFEGSANHSVNALVSNQENTVVLVGRRVGAKFLTKFQQLWAKGTSFPRYRNFPPIKVWRNGRVSRSNPKKARSKKSRHKAKQPKTPTKKPPSRTPASKRTEQLDDQSPPAKRARFDSSLTQTIDFSRLDSMYLELFLAKQMSCSSFL